MALHNDLYEKLRLLQQPVEVFADVKADMSYPPEREVMLSAAKLKAIMTGEIANEGLAPKEADAILKYVVAKIRKNLSQSYGTNLDDETLLGACGFASTLGHHLLDDIQCKSREIQILDIPGADHQHAALLLTLPIRRDDTVKDTLFLVDASFKQFCTVNDFRKPTLLGGGTDITTQAGYRLSKTKEGADLARTLLEKGYIELTPKHAKLYLDAVSEKPFSQNANEYLELFAKCKAQKPHRSRDEMEKYDISFPPLPPYITAPEEVSRQHQTSLRATDVRSR